MTESVTTPRSRSRSTRSSARSRQRSAAAAGSTSARATARSGSTPAGDASRDERTLDLFGDPVLEPGEGAQMAARDEAGAQADASVDVADDVASGRQPALDGFSAPEGATVAEPADAAAGAVTREGATVAHGASLHEGGDVANADLVPASGGIAIKEADVPSADDAVSKAPDSPEAGDEVGKAVIDGAAAKSHDARSSGAAVKERRASSGGKRRTPAGASDAKAEQAAPVVSSDGTTLEAAGADAVPTISPQTSAQPIKPTITANTSNTSNTANTQDAVPQAGATASPVTQPPPSAASFVTKPSTERAPPPAPAFDPDIHLRPLTDRLAALQADVDTLTRAADREMRRVNRLLLALAVVALAGLVALVMQTRQIAHLKQDVATKQQRIDRLASDLSTQQATLMTLEEHHEALLSQVDRLQRNANREAAVAKRARRTR
ncbi:flagellar hook-length control protein FliK [Burkholderia metallica]|uniref:Flagellar hook-length control protein FliK n=1 Tax=Burkholderia metallica TaxID=488729 RepID=A0ABT8PK37_9BURK|nr:flagellar hook-length control protein FliK [Burkholderia metallica]MDN7935515.1 flagellar hook-length control protein FliK [Burkholderia metallica]